MEINFNLDILIQNNLTFEGYFILYCLNENCEKELVDYVNNCDKIPDPTFRNLEKKGLILIKPNTEVITYSSLKLTKEGRNLLTIDNIVELFEDFRTYYPKSTKAGRKLHSNLKKCLIIYKRIIGNNRAMHDILCKCAQLYQQEKIRTNGEEYYQLLETWLHQENYKQYIDEAEKNDVINDEDDSNVTSI